MNSKSHRSLTAALIALACTASSAAAGVYASTTSAPIVSAAESAISGTLSFDFNSHFVSYGADVWGDGSSMSDPIFNPSIELVWALPGGWSAKLGAWADVNSKAPPGYPSIGGRVQEVDVWAGIGYTIDKLSLGVTYQNWIYGDETEEVLDLTIAYDTLLSPSLTIHTRLDEGAANDTGTILLLGVSHSVEAGPVTVSFPLGIAFFLDEDFHAAGAEDGLGYGSIGIQAAMPLGAPGSAYGDWTLKAGLTYYVTDQEVIPNNPKGDFLTANLGISVAF
jgi:hypothetical protein